MSDRRIGAALAALALAVAAGASGCGGSTAALHPTSTGSDRPQQTARPLTIRTPLATLRIPGRVRARIAAARPANALAAVRFFLSRHTTVRRSAGSAVTAWPPGAARRVLAAVRSPATRLALDPTVTAVQLRLPVIHQVWRNNCESAALSMMLGGRVSQQRLQRLLPRAQPRLPQVEDGVTVWGDPNRGFVGPATGGGYGVYHGPLLQLARRFDRGTTDLTGAGLAQIEAALRAGRPVVAWIQLGPSIPVMWRTPAGTVIHANWAEHAVTLTGWQPDTIVYNNPWTGTTERFTIAGFVQVWNTLGDQAIAGSSVFRSS